MLVPDDKARENCRRKPCPWRHLAAAAQTTVPLHAVGLSEGADGWRQVQGLGLHIFTVPILARKCHPDACETDLLDC